MHPYQLICQQQLGGCYAHHTEASLRALQLQTVHVESIADSLAGCFSVALVLPLAAGQTHLIRLVARIVRHCVYVLYVFSTVATARRSYIYSALFPLFYRVKMCNTLPLLVTQQMMQSLRWHKDFKCSQVVAVAAKKCGQVSLDIEI